MFSIFCVSKQKVKNNIFNQFKTPAFYLSISIELHPQSQLLHLYVLLIIDQLPDIVGLLFDQDVEAGRGGDANADADQHDVPDMEDCDVPDMEDFDVSDEEDFDDPWILGY